MVQRVGFNLV